MRCGPRGRDVVAHFVARAVARANVHAIAHPARDQQSRRLGWRGTGPAASDPSRRVGSLPPSGRDAAGRGAAAGRIPGGRRRGAQSRRRPRCCVAVAATAGEPAQRRGRAGASRRGERLRCQSRTRLRHEPRTPASRRYRGRLVVLRQPGRQPAGCRLGAARAVERAPLHPRPCAQRREYAHRARAVRRGRGATPGHRLQQRDRAASACCAADGVIVERSDRERHRHRALSP